MKNIFFLISIIFPLFTNAQEVFSIDKITHLELGNWDIYPSVKNNELYAKRYIIKTTPLEIIESTHPETKEHLAQNNVSIMSIDDVKKMSKEEIIENLKNKEWLINKIRQNNNDYLQTIQMVTPNLWLNRLYCFNNDDYLIDRTQKSWNIIMKQIFPMLFVSLPNNAIYLQGNKNNSNYIIPQDDKFITGFNSGLGTGGKSEIIEEFNKEKLNIDIEKNTYQSLNDSFIIKKLANGKFQLTDYSGDSLNLKTLDESFDEIVKNQYFIVTKNNGYYDIYNTLLQPIIKNTSSYNFDGYYIQILQNGQVTKLGALGNINKPFYQYYGKCGTVPSYYHEIKKNKNGIYTIVSRGGYVIANSKKVSFQVKSKVKIDKLKWLDGDNRIGYSSLDYIDDDINLSRELMVVESNKKFGIAIPEYNKTTVNIKLLTGITFDKVVFTSYYEPLLLIKNQETFIFSMSLEKPIIYGPYKEVGERKKYFIRYTKENGKKGWHNLLNGDSIDDE